MDFGKGSRKKAPWRAVRRFVDSVRPRRGGGTDSGGTPRRAAFRLTFSQEADLDARPSLVRSRRRRLRRTRVYREHEGRRGSVRQSPRGAVRSARWGAVRRRDPDGPSRRRGLPGATAAVRGCRAACVATTGFDTRAEMIRVGGFEGSLRAGQVRCVGPCVPALAAICPEAETACGEEQKENRDEGTHFRRKVSNPLDPGLSIGGLRHPAATGCDWKCRDL